MVKEIVKIEKLLIDPTSINKEDVDFLDKLTSTYPYYQTGQLLLTKGLLNLNSIRYKKQLKKCAAFTLDRKKLFELIMLKNNKEKVKKDISKNSLKIDKTFISKDQEYFSFSEWLTLSKVKKINRNNDEIISYNDIEEKIKNNIAKKTGFFKPISNAKESLIENHKIITPTLAKVYLEQGHYEKAIFAYKALSLKYPKKSSLFAEKIKLINKLNKS